MSTNQTTLRCGSSFGNHGDENVPESISWKCLSMKLGIHSSRYISPMQAIVFFGPQPQDPFRGGVTGLERYVH